MSSESNGGTGTEQVNGGVPAPDRESAGNGTLSIPKDDAYHILQNGRRRAALRYLLTRDGDLFRMDDLVEAVAVWEADTSAEDVAEEQRQRVYIALYQSHLPKLDAHDVIDYDQSSGLITVRPLAAVLEPLLGDRLHADDRLYVEPAGDAEDDENGGGLLSSLLDC
jgi:hypothetical protein